MPDAERSTQSVTIMMTDVEGSTALRLERGDRIADDILAMHAAIVRDQVRQHGGRERQFLGDGFLLSFPTTVGAVDCAIGIQQAFVEHNAGEPEREVRVRIGIHLGEVSERRGQLYGQAVHAAARVMAEAAGGQILVSSAVRERVEGDDVGPREMERFVDSGLFWLKGFPERWRLYELTWSGRSTEQRVGTVASLTPLVERDGERATLRRAVDEARAGRGGLVVVAGEAGVGKSRMVTEISLEAEARGMRVLVGHCVEMQGAPPYLPYVEMIEQAASNPRSPEALRDALAGVAPEIARIAPALRRVLPDILPPVELPPELARRYLWNSFGEFLARAAQRQPLLLVLEDLHWADESSVLLTDYLASLLPQLPVLILGTFRDDEIHLSQPLARVVGQLVRRRLADRVALHRLSLEGVRAMIEALAGQAAPEQLVRAVEGRTEGNPFFVEEVYLHLLESGSVFDEHGGMRRDAHFDEVSVPEGIRLVLGDRIEHLAASTRRVLASAAVVGRVFAPDLVGEVAGAVPDAVVEAFDQAERARLVGPAKAAGLLMFSHELIRQTLLSGTSTLDRERLHLRAADATERRYVDDLEAHADDLVHHLSLAGRSADPTRLVRYLSIAGERAAAAAAFEDAVSRFREALLLLPPSARQQRAELLERLAPALRGTGSWNDALDAMNEALQLYQELGSTDAMGRVSSWTAYYLAWTMRVADAVRVAQSALTLIGDATNPDRARLVGVIATALSLGGDRDAGTHMFDQARALAEQARDERALADVLHNQTLHHMAHAEFPEGVRIGMRAAEIFEREGALWDLCSVQAFVIFQDGITGSREQANRFADKAMATADRLGHVGAKFMLLIDRARVNASHGDVGAVEALGLEIIDACQRAALPWVYIGHDFVALAAHWRGDAQRAEGEFRRAIALEPEGAFVGQSMPLLAKHLALTGRAGEVLDLYQAARSLFPSTDRLDGLGAWSCMLGLVEPLYLSGYRAEAAALLPVVEKALDRGPDWITFDCRSVRTRAGVAATACGRWDDAEHHFTSAQAHARRTSNELELADAQRLHTRMILDRGRPDDAPRAARLLSDALTVYRTFDMPRYAAEAEQLLSQVDVLARQLGEGRPTVQLPNSQ